MVKIGIDKISISGPKYDGGWTITLETGEYEKEKVLEVGNLEPPVYVTIREHGKIKSSPKVRKTLSLQEEKNEGSK